jgi:nucleotide-binding universal stress UspA family protein
MASVHELPLTALYVIDEKTVADVAAASGEPVDQVRGQLEEKGWHYLQHVTRMAKNHGVDCERLMRDGLVHRQIADVVRDLGVDLIVIGRGGHQNSGRGSMGSVSEHVIEYSPCSVLVIKSP